MTPDANRKRRWKWHALAIGVIAAASCLIFFKNFYLRGMLMHVDMTFPTSISRNFSLYAHTWWQYGSVQNIWNTQRVLWAYPLLAVVKVLGLSTSQYLLILFIGTFALAGASMYALSFHVIGSLEEKLGITNSYAPFVGAVFSGLIFMYNPFSVSHLWPYFGYPGYAALPLAFLFLLKAVDSPRLKYVIGLAIIIAVAGTGPINVVWFWLMIIAFLVFHLVSNRFRKESLVTTVKIVLPLAVVYGLLSAMWMFPIAGAQFINKPFVPFYSPLLTQRVLDALSAQNTIMNNLRFAAGWGMPVNPQVTGTVPIVLSFALPVLALAGLLALGRKMLTNRTIVFWSVMFVASVLLATGSAFILRGPYSYFTLRAPGVASFGWVLRSADRWLCYAAVFYALVLSVLAAWLLGARGAFKKVLAVAVVAVVLISFGQISLSYARTVARPVWTPFSRDGFHYSWAPEKRLGAFDVYSSNANLNDLQDLFGPDNYYFWLESLLLPALPGPLQPLNRDFMVKPDLTSKLLMPFSARYLIYDRSVPVYQFAQAFENDRSLSLAKRTDILDVFKLKDSVPYIRPALRTVRIDSYYDELALAQKLSTDELKRISFVEKARPIDRKYGVLSMSDYAVPVDINSSFEETAGGLPAGWTPVKQDARVIYRIDTTTRVSGKKSLRIVNSSSEDLSLAQVNGPEVPVQPGEIYQVESNIKYSNSNWTYVGLEGYRPADGRWVDMVSCPVAMAGNSGWKTTRMSFYMPAGFSKIRPVLAAGWKKDSSGPPATSWFDDVKISQVDGRFYSDLLGGGAGPTVQYKQVSPEKFTVKVKGAAEPFVLVLGEAYDPLWQARVAGGEAVDPSRVYGLTTAFPLDRKGNFELSINYLPQPWFIDGLVVSLVALALCVAYLVFAWLSPRRRKRKAASEDGGPPGG
jgi:hypothetical protein